MADVLICDTLDPKALDIFRENGFTVDVKTGQSEEELKTLAGSYRALAVRSQTKITAGILENAGRLKVIGRAGIGVDNIDLEAATAKGIVVMNSPSGNAVTTAEHAVALLLALARKIPQANQSVHQGLWERKKFVGTELCRKVLGILGCGNIGSKVARRAKGLRMKVIAFDPFLSPEKAEQEGIEKVEFDDFFSRADFISLHTPLTEETRHIINDTSIALMKPGLRLINCARGGLIDEDALLRGLKSGQIAGAAIDVFEEEPPQNSKLFGKEGIILTPHLGASTREAQETVALQIAEQICAYLKKNEIINSVNVPSVTADEYKKLEPYLKLMFKLGRLTGRLLSSPVKAIRIQYSGDAAHLEKNTLLTQAFLTELLKRHVSNINMVNSEHIAEKRGIDLFETRHGHLQNYKTHIQVHVETQQSKYLFAGTLFDGTLPRLIQIGDIYLESPLEGNMLYIDNKDRPGAIGIIGRILGNHAVNIANFFLGRSSSKNTNALALVEIDTLPPKELLSELKKLDVVNRVEVIRF